MSIKIRNILGRTSVMRLVKLGCYVCNFFCSFFPMRDYIVLESHPDFTCNTFALYRYMIKMGVNKHYRIIWLCDKNNVGKLSDDNIGYLPLKSASLIDRVRFYFVCNRAKVLITCNRHISNWKVSKKQLNIYLDHGSQLKSMLFSDGSKFNLRCDYLMCQSDFFIKPNLEQYTLKREQIICTGLPRNDELFEKYNSIYKIVSTPSAFKKIIIWAPTFRSHKNKSRIDCTFSHPLGLPVLSGNKDAELLNNILKEKNILLIVKPHPAQDMSIMRSLNLSNVKLLYNSELESNSIQINELLAQSDALITDYSSIYYDYLLLGRPIGITLDDLKEYQKEHGFVFSNPLDVLKGRYIYTVNDLICFVSEVANNKDTALDERAMLKDKVHDFKDADSSKRVYDFIISHLKE